MIRHTDIERVGAGPEDKSLALYSSTEFDPVDTEFNQVKQKARLIIRRLNTNIEPQGSIESGSYMYHYLIENYIAYLCICDRSYPRKLAFTYLADVAREFDKNHGDAARRARVAHEFVAFDTYIRETVKTYQDSRATRNLDKLNDELKDVSQVMTRNIEDLLSRGGSLERMGDISSRLKEDSRKYKRSAQQINWELLLKQYGPVAALVFIMIVFIWWRFF